MPTWGWVCLGLGVGVFGVLWLLLKLMTISYNRKLKRLEEFGETVVGRIFLANPSVYHGDTAPNFEFAFVVFTRDNDDSEEHLAFLGEIVRRLDGFTADEDSEEEKKLAWSLETQRTQDGVLRIPDRVTDGREVYFCSVGVSRELLPGRKLTRNYLHLRVILDGDDRDEMMAPYPDGPTA